MPVSVRKQAALHVGDLLEAKIEKGQITFTPKNTIDREIALAMEDMKHGRGIGPFKTAQVAIRALHREARKYKAKK